MGSALPPRPSCVRRSVDRRTGPRGVPAPGVARHRPCRVDPPTRLSPLRSSTDGRLPRKVTRAVSTRARRAATSPEVLGLLQHDPPSESTGPHRSLGAAHAGMPLPLRSVSRVSHPPDGLLLGRLATVFRSQRSWSPTPFRAHARPERRHLSAPPCPPAVHRTTAPARHDWRASALAPCTAGPDCRDASRESCLRAAGARCGAARLQGLAPRVELETTARAVTPAWRSRLSWASGSSPGCSPRSRLAASDTAHAAPARLAPPTGFARDASIARVVEGLRRAEASLARSCGLRGPSECVRHRAGRPRSRAPADPPEVSLPRRRPPFFRVGPALAHGFTAGSGRVAAAPEHPLRAVTCRSLGSGPRA